MLTREEQAAIVERFKQHAFWYVKQKTRVQRGQVSAQSFKRSLAERLDEFADFLKECGGVSHLQVQQVPHTEHVCESAEPVQARSNVSALQARSVLRGQGAVEPERV